MNKSDMKDWKIVIESRTGLLDISFKEIWKYRNLIFSLIKRNYEVQYKQTILGMLWMFITPILSSGLFSFVFGTVGGFSTDGTPQFLFFLSGNILWSLFAGCVHYNMDIFQVNAYIMGKVYFPRLVIPIANTLYNILKFAFSFILLIGVWGYFLVRNEIEFTGIKLLGIPIAVLEVTLLAAAVGMIISCITIKYRDLNVLVSFGLQLLMYASPVVYPMSQLPEKAKLFISINPIAPILELFRFSLTGHADLSVPRILYSAGATIFLFLVGIIMYNQTEKNFIDIV